MYFCFVGYIMSLLQLLNSTRAATDNHGKKASGAVLLTETWLMDTEI